ncbi:MAG: FHA domain-containing protein [Agathobacter sp.]|nr:FHA domain-containing protein [Agathobacter sp.]
MRIRKGLVVLSILCILLGIGKVNVYADSKDSPTVKIRVEYVNDKEQRKVVAQGNGVLIGTDKGCNAVVTPLDLVTLTKKEKKKNKIPAKAKIEIIVRLDSQSVEEVASVEATNKSLNFAILKLGGNLYANHIVFDLDSNAYEPNQPIYAVNIKGKKKEGILAGTKGSGNSMFLVHTVKTDSSLVGTGLFNANNEFIGLCIKSKSKKTGSAVPANSIATTLTTLGIAYDVADHTDHSADTKELTAALKIVEELDLSIYKEESKQVLVEAISHAKEVLEKAQPTQEEVDEAYKALTFAQESLVKIKISITTIVLLVVLGVFAITVMGLIIFIVCDKKKRKKQQLEAEEIEKKRAPKYHDAYKPDVSRTYVTNSGLQGNNMPVSNMSGRIIEGFAPSSKEISTNIGETTVFQPTGVGLVLYVESLQNSFAVNSFPFIIGKNNYEANLTLNNSAVSRKHLAVYNDNGKFRVVDLGSKNGTLINGMRIVPGVAHDIANGDILTIANEKIHVRIN